MTSFTVDLLDASNNPIGDGPLINVLSVSIEEKLDESGAVSFTVPATDIRVATLISQAARFRVRLSSGALVYGIIDKDVMDATAEQPTRTINGADMLRELQHHTMGWWVFFDNQDVVNVVLPAVLLGTNWTLSTSDVSGTDIYYRFDGDSRLAALIKIAEATGKHFRLTSTFRQIEWGDFFDNVVDVTFTNLAAATVNYDGIPIIGSLRVTSDRGPVVNRIFPFGAGHDDGNLNRAKVSLFHLAANDARWANIKAAPGMRGAQTTVSAVGSEDHQYLVADSSGFLDWPITQLFWCYDPADLTGGRGYDFVVKSVETGIVWVRGSPTVPAPPASYPAYLIANPQLYLEDATAFAADPHDAVVIFDDITLTDLSLPSFALAAAQLYERAAQYLALHKSPQISYALTALNCPEDVHPGDVVHVTYSGAVTRDGVTIDWVDVDADLNVINLTRRFNADGSTETTLEVSNVKMQPANSSGAISHAVGSVGSHAATVGALGGYASPTGGGAGTQGGVVSPGYLYLILADNATAVIATAAEGIGTLFVLCIEDGSVSMFALTGPNHVAYEMLDPQEQFTAASGTDGMTNVYCEASTPYSYYVENKRGAERSYYIWLHMAKVN